MAPLQVQDRSNHNSHPVSNSHQNQNQNQNLNPDPSLRPNSISRHSTSFISLSAIRSSARRITISLSPAKQLDPYHSSGQESPPRFSTDRSSTLSTKSPQTIRKARRASSSTASLPYFPDTKVSSQSPTKHYLSPSASFPAQSAPRGLRKVERSVTTSAAPDEHSSHVPSSLAMIVTPFANSFRTETGKPPGSSQGNSAFTQGGNVAPLPGSGLSAGYTSAPPGGLHNPNTVYQHIQELSTKRIATLDYLRKA